MDWVTELYAGLRAEAEAQGATIVGGDLVRSERVVISVTAIGSLAGAQPVVRTGAQPGDVVAVAGRLGWAAAGLSILSRGFRTPRALVDAHRRPEPPYEAARAAAAAGATAMIDVSDGLVADLGHIARASGVAIEIDPTLLVVAEPVASAASAFNADPLVWVLTGGEDHAVAATFPAGTALPAGFTAIGTVADLVDVPVLEGPGVDGGRARAPRSGWPRPLPGLSAREVRPAGVASGRGTSGTEACLGYTAGRRRRERP